VINKFVDDVEMLLKNLIIQIKTDSIQSLLMKRIDKFKEVNPSFKNWVRSLDNNPELILFTNLSFI